MTKVERFFDYMNIEEDRKVKSVVLIFKGVAFAWLEQTVRNKVKFNKNPVRSWDKLKKLLQQRFFPSDFEGVLFTQHHQCNQGNRSVPEYAREFHILSSRNYLNET